MATVISQPRIVKGVRHFAYGEKRPWSDFQPKMASAIIVMHLVGIYAVVAHIVTGRWPEPKVLVTAGVLYVFSGLFGIAMGYHRYFTHGGFKTGRVMQAIMLIAAGLALEGAAPDWLKAHWYHHQRSDQPGDPHSPYQYWGIKGWFWAHIGWLFYKRNLPATLPTSRQKIIDDPLVKLQAKFYWVFFVATLGIPFAIGGWDGLLVAGVLRVVLFLNLTWAINSVCHVWGSTVAVKYHNAAGTLVTKKEGDGSRNNWWLAWLTFGEANHALHHLFERVAFHGWKWWMPDAAKWTLVLLEKVHVVYDIERPPPDAIVEPGALDLPKDSLIHRGLYGLAA